MHSRNSRYDFPFAAAKGLCWGVMLGGSCWIILGAIAWWLL